MSEPETLILSVDPASQEGDHAAGVLARRLPGGRLEILAVAPVWARGTPFISGQCVRVLGVDAIVTTTGPRAA